MQISSMFRVASRMTQPAVSSQVPLFTGDEVSSPSRVPYSVSEDTIKDFLDGLGSEQRAKVEKRVLEFARIYCASEMPQKLETPENVKVIAAVQLWVRYTRQKVDSLLDNLH